MTLFISLFVTSRNLLFGVFLPRKIIEKFLAKNSRKFQASVTERCTSLSKSSGMFRQNLLKVALKKINLKKPFTTYKLLQKWFLKFPVRFFYLYTYPPIYISLFVSYMTHIFCIRIHICKKVLRPAFTVPEMKSEKKQVLMFVLHLLLYFINLFNIILSFNKSF